MRHKLSAWTVITLLLLVAWIPAFIPDPTKLVDIFHRQSSHDSWMAFVSTYMTFVTEPLTAIAALIGLYKFTMVVVKRADQGRIHGRP